MFSARTAAAAALIVFAGSAVPAAAQQSSPGGGSLPERQRVMFQPPAAAFAFPPTNERYLAAKQEPGDGCAPAWPCRLRLFGVIGKNGGIGLKGPALTW